jgi:hypothetical protein
MINDKYILLAYVNRSGSTFLSAQLNARPEICSCPEAEALVHLLLRNCCAKVTPQIAAKLDNLIAADYKLSKWGLPPMGGAVSKLPSCLSAFMAVLSQYKKMRKPQASHILFKEQNLIGPMLKGSFAGCSNISSIALIRDCRAVALSQLTSLIPETGQPFAANTFTAARYWHRFAQKTMQASGAGLAMMLRYEDIVSAAQNELAGISIYCGLPASAANTCPDAGFVTDIHKQLHSKASGPALHDRKLAWETQLSPYRKAVCNIVAGKSLRATGYKHNRGHISLKGYFRLGSEIICWAGSTAKAKLKWMFLY